jgi:tetratricopeptide (TPR) repeat protein
MAEELGDRQLLGLALAVKTSLHMWYLQPGEVVDSGLRAVELLRSAGDLWGLANALWITQWVLLFLGRFDEAAEMVREGEPLALRLGHLVAVMSFRRGSSYGELMLTGDLDRWEQFWREDLEMCRSVNKAWISGSYSALGFAHFCRGRWREALKSAPEATRLEARGPFAGVDWAAIFLGKAYIGDRDAAMSMLEQKRSALPRPGRANTIGAWMALLLVIEGLAVLEERDEAAKLYPLALEATGTGALTVFPLGPPHEYAGIAAACGGQWEKAEQHYGEALRLAHELPVVIAQPEVRRWYARMLLDRNAAGDRDKAFRLLTEAIAMYREIGMPKHVEMAEALLGEV